MGRKTGTLIYRLPVEIADSFKDEYEKHGDFSGELSVSRGSVVYTGTRFEEFESLLRKHLKKVGYTEKVDISNVTQKYKSIFEDPEFNMKIHMKIDVHERTFKGKTTDSQYKVIRTYPLNFEEPGDIEKALYELRREFDDNIKKRMSFTGHIEFDGKRKKIKTTKPRKPKTVIRRVKKATSKMGATKPKKKK